MPIGSKSAYQSANQWKDFVNIVEMTTDVPAVDYINIKLYPNPATNEFGIETGEKINAVSIYNLNGTLILSKQVLDNNVVNINSLVSGIYLVKVQTVNGVIMKKLIKKQL